jgi:hypothetical protein
MPRNIVFMTALTIFAAGSMRAQSGNQSLTPAPNGPFGGPILTTPVASLPTPAPTAGISDAGRAGISNASSPSSAEAGTGYATTGGTETTPSVTPAEETRVNDLAPSTSVSNASEVAAASGISVGEASARYKAAKGTQNARMLTNDEVQKMVDSKTGVTMAKNMPPLGPGPTPQNGVSASAASQTMTAQSSTPGTAAQGVSQSAQGSTSVGQPGQPRAGSPPPVDGSQAQPAGSTATAGSSTTPQINPNQQSNDAQGSSRLPTTSTFLPLLGLLGLASGGIGLWFRKFRK